MYKNGTLPHLQFPENLWNELATTLQKIKGAGQQPLIAVFDADGTLWDTDIGEAFFNYQIRNSGLSLPPDPWKHYLDWKSKDPRAAYLWLAQVSNGCAIHQVESWAEAAIRTLDVFPVFESQKRLIQYMHDLGYEVYVVTASVEWAVVPAAARLGIPKHRVLGIKTKIQNGFVTSEQDGPITWREGKATAILQATGGARPVFASGNTTGDTALLETATHLQLAVRSRNAHTELAATETALYYHARREGWLTHEF
jgi:phosphoserine phosphatase